MLLTIATRRRRNMSKFSICLVIICGALQIATSVQYAGYVHKWEDDVYVLHCSPIIDNYTFQPVSQTIDDLPYNATRVKTTCFAKKMVVRLRFLGLTHVRELTLDTFTVPSDYGQMFRGITGLSKLTLRNLTWSNMTKSTFDGLSTLRSLFVEQLDDLEYMHPDVLVPLEALESLSFKHVGATNDRLMYRDYATLLRSQSFNLRRLVMYAVHSENHPETSLNIDTMFNNGLSSGKLRYLDLGCNNIIKMEGNPARSWPVLEYISLAENVLLGASKLVSFWMQFYTHISIKTIDLSKINEHALSTGDAIFKLVVDGTCQSGLPVVLGPHMQSVSLRDAVFVANTRTHHFPLCFLDRNDTMYYLDFSNARSTTPMFFSPMSLRALRYLNMQTLDTSRLTVSAFSQMPNLTMLLLGKTDIGHSITNDSQNSMFANNTNLRMLDLSECQITTVPPEEFSHLHQLQTLNLSFNEMTAFTVKLSQLTALTLLNISHNRLTTLSSTTRQELDYIAYRRTIQVDICGNPLLCLPDQMEFLTWAKTTRVQFVNADKTFCSGEHGTQRMYFGVESKTTMGGVTEMSEKVVNNGWKYGVGISLSLIGVVIPSLAYVLYRYRWKCALYYHDMNRRRTQ